jgi:hypothetical protein
MSINGARTKKILDTYHISVGQISEPSSLEVSWKPFLWEPFVLMLGAVFFSFFIFGDVQTDDGGIVYLTFAAIGLVVIFLISFFKRSLASTFNSSNGQLALYKGGMYFSKIDASDRKIAFADIVRVGARRYIRRYGDGFQIFLVLKHRENLDITGTDLSFSEAQLCAETIREYLGIKEKLLAVD